MKKIVSLGLMILGLAGLLASGFCYHAFLSFEKKFFQEKQEEAVALTRSAAEEIDAILRGVMLKAESVAEGLATGRINKDNLHAVLKEVAGSKEYIYGIAVAYAPYAYDGEQRLYAPYYVKKESGNPECVQIEEIYDYTAEGHAWYSATLEQGSQWFEPFYGRAGEVLETVYSVPFYEGGGSGGKGQVRGVVTISLPMDYLYAIIHDLDLGVNGFAALVSGEGAYLYHPDDTFVRESRTILEVAESKGDKDRIKAARMSVRGERGVLEHRSTTTGLDSWLVVEPVPVTGWSLQNTFIKDDFSYDVSVPRHLLIWMSFAVFLFILPTAAGITGWKGWNAGKLWFVSIFAALLLTAGIGFIWFATLSYSPFQQTEGPVISDKKTLDNLIHSYERKSIQNHTEKPVFVPTGISIQSMKYSEDKDLSVVGYVWKKYGEGEIDQQSRGFTIPGAEELEIAEPYRLTSGGREIVRWPFRARIKQNVESADYPLEQETIAIELRSADVDNNEFLIPDLEAYKVLSPSALPGLDRDILIKGWDIKGSRFTLKETSYNSNLGGVRTLSRMDIPSLQYTISVRRNFVDSFISSLTPLIVVAILLFVILLLTTEDKTLRQKFEAGTSKVIAMCSALFFVIIFAHIDIRKSISPNNIFYLEYFYLVMYLALLGVSTNAVLFPLARDYSLIRYKNNLVAKVIYWPGVMSLLYLLTVFQFY